MHFQMALALFRSTQYELSNIPTRDMEGGEKRLTTEADDPSPVECKQVLQDCTQNTFKR